MKATESCQFLCQSVENFVSFLTTYLHIISVEKIYFIIDVPNQVECIFTNGTGRQVLHRDNNQNIYGMTVADGELYLIGLKERYFIIVIAVYCSIREFQFI